MTPKNEVLALGCEAVSLAAIDAGVKGVFGYPGTPSTEVFESAEHLINKLNDGRVARWAANEKVAYEMALGASYSGYRTMVTMKHVGLNVAMDAFVNSGITGAQGGFVVVVADDPGMHSSQNEQDSRYLADFANIPCLEPSTPQEVYNYTQQAFEISEKLKLPVLLRLVTRLAHCRGQVVRKEMKAPICVGKPKKEDIQNWILVPSMARVQYKKLREKMPALYEAASSFNTNSKGKSKTAVLASGMGRAYYNQLKRQFNDLENYDLFEVGAYPVMDDIFETIANTYETIYIFEEDYSYLEDKILARTKAEVHGRRNNKVPTLGELTPLSMRKTLGLELPKSKAAVNMDVPPRLPRLCDGCGHADAFEAINTALKNVGVTDPRIFGDIGCYTLGAYEPFNSIHTCVEMGASEGMALGASLVGNEPAIGVMGDSTFFHSGLSSLISMARTESNVTLVILDNRSVGMTGQQKTVALDVIPNVVRGAGFSDDQIHELIPLPKQHDTNVKIMEKALSHKGPDVVIFRRECIQALRKGVNK